MRTCVFATYLLISCPAHTQTTLQFLRLPTGCLCARWLLSLVQQHERTRGKGLIIEEYSVCNQLPQSPNRELCILYIAMGCVPVHCHDVGGAQGISARQGLRRRRAASWSMA